MSDDIKDTSALLGSRICHDLISPLGAISNGLELLAMSGIASSPEMTLI
jgi:histidine phosphotransferase ChpT